MAKEKNENNETPVQPAKNVEKELLDALEALKNEYAALGKTLEDTKAELNARNDSYVRITAEYENYRKRTAAERRRPTPKPTPARPSCSCRWRTRWSAPPNWRRRTRAWTRCASSFPTSSAAGHHRD